MVHSIELRQLLKVGQAEKERKKVVVFYYNSISKAQRSLIIGTPFYFLTQYYCSLIKSTQLTLSLAAMRKERVELV
jgi:flagellar assembly factor FliW